jgi:uncharacterized OB-fold protein
LTYEASLGEPFKNGIRAGKLRLPRCTDCGRFHWQPMRRCPHCRSDAIAWCDVDPGGVIFTHTTVRHAFGGELVQSVPYTVALIEIAAAPGVRLVAELAGDTAVAIGDAVEPVFESSGQEPRLLYKARE